MQHTTANKQTKERVHSRLSWCLLLLTTPIISLLLLIMLIQIIKQHYENAHKYECLFYGKGLYKYVCTYTINNNQKSYWDLLQLSRLSNYYVG